MQVTNMASPNNNYLELNFVGETATGKGNNKKFVMENLLDGTFRATESRVGITIGRHRPRSYVLPMERWEETYQAKVKRGYLLTKEQKTIEKNNINGMDYRPVEDEAVNEIITRLLQFTNNALTQNYTVKVDDISDAMISYGKKILDSLAKDFERMSVAEFNSRIKTLYAAIPRRMDNLSKFLAKRKLDFNDIVANEQELFDIMVSQVRCEKKFADMKERPTILETYHLDWKSVTEEEEQLIRSKLGGNSSEYVRAWKVKNHITEKRFHDFCQKEHLTEEEGISHLFHGSRNENFWSIVTTGLTINPSNVVITGKMFGNGCYFAPLAKKSLNYTSRTGSIYAKGTQKTGFLAIYKVATGKTYDLFKSESDLNWSRLQERCPGAHCTWAHAGQSLYNDEVVVYRDDQSTIEYLIEMTA